jgi:hypothetical protein
VSYYEQAPYSSPAPYPESAPARAQRSTAALLSAIFAAAVAALGFVSAVLSVLAPRILAALNSDFSSISILFGVLSIVSALLGIAALVTGIVALARDRHASNLGWAAAGTAVGGAVVVTSLVSFGSSVVSSF